MLVQLAVNTENWTLPIWRPSMGEPATKPEKRAVAAAMAMVGFILIDWKENCCRLL